MNSGSQAEVWPSPAPIRGAWHLRCIRALALLLIALMSGGASFAYSVLTHEEIVDLLWAGELRPLLIERFPELSEGQLKKPTPTPMEARSSRTSATTRSAAWNSAT